MNHTWIQKAEQDCIEAAWSDERRDLVSALKEFERAVRADER